MRKTAAAAARWVNGDMMALRRNGNGRLFHIAQEQPKNVISKGYGHAEPEAGDTAQLSKPHRNSAGLYAGVMHAGGVWGSNDIVHQDCPPNGEPRDHELVPAAVPIPRRGE